jgi:hypothetical protein
MYIGIYIFIKGTYFLHIVIYLWLTVRIHSNKLEKFVLVKLLMNDCLFLLISKSAWLYSTHIGFVIKVVKNIFEIQNLESTTPL